MEKKLYISLAVISLFCSLVLNACKEKHLQKRNTLPEELFKEGDIALRRGTGFTSRVVLATDEKGIYSHTGILKRENGVWYVIHAVPGEPEFEGDVDRVKMEKIELFFSNEKATRGAVMRLQADSTAAHRAAKNALELSRKQVPFDHCYDLNDTTELYCTELIDYVYRKEGVDLPEERITPINIPGFKGDYLMPSDIAQSKRLCTIYYF